MANLFSDLLTLRDTEGVITNASTYAGESITAAAFYDLQSNPGIGDVILMMDIPSNAKIYNLPRYNVDIGSGSNTDWGIYASRKFIDTDPDLIKTTYEQNEVIKVDAFDNSSGVLNITVLNNANDTRFQDEGTSNTIDRVGETLWELADLNQDPQIDLRLGISFEDNFSIFTGGTLVLIAQYTAK